MFGLFKKKEEPRIKENYTEYKEDLLKLFEHMNEYVRDASIFCPREYIWLKCQNIPENEKLEYFFGVAAEIPISQFWLNVITNKPKFPNEDQFNNDLKLLCEKIQDGIKEWSKQTSSHPGDQYTLDLAKKLFPLIRKKNLIDIMEDLEIDLAELVKTDIIECWEKETKFVFNLLEDRKLKLKSTFKKAKDAGNDEFGNYSY